MRKRRMGRIGDVIAENAEEERRRESTAEGAEGAEGAERTEREEREEREGERKETPWMARETGVGGWMAAGRVWGVGRPWDRCGGGGTFRRFRAYSPISGGFR
jgi:hypothetical protein